MGANSIVSASTYQAVHQLFEEQARKMPGAIAVEFEGVCLTYQELNWRANQLAHHLQSMGVGPDVPVGLCVERSLDMVIALFAILKAGGAYVPLDPTYPQDRLAGILEDSQPSVLITHQCLKLQLLKPLLSKLQANLLCIDEKSVVSLLARQPFTNLNRQVEAHHLAYVIYTSGSTGRPKGVAIEHRNTLALIDWATDFFSPQQLAGVLASTSLCFDLSVFEIFVPLACGGIVILAQNALHLADLKAANRVTLINTVPSAIAALLRQRAIPPSVETINLAGEPLQNALVQKLYELNHVKAVFNLYGPSEDTTYSTVALVPRDETGIPSIGHPISGTQIYLLDAELTPVPPGVEGELYISGSGLARGYLNQPELTAERFIPNPFSPDPASRLYKTGDLAVFAPDGNLKFLGRIDHQVKVRGFRIELGEIEATLNQHKAVSESVVVAQHDSSGHTRLVAYVIPDTPQEKSHASNGLSDSLDEQVQQWRQVWNSTYSQPSEAADAAFNSVGWNDSFTGLPMASHEVHEWVDRTIERILSLNPQKVMEIGCGMGLLLFGIAPYCERYVGLDLSAAAMHTLQQRLDDDPERWSHVKVMARAAHEVEGIALESLDTVIINSVIQYFPDVHYLVRVLERVVKLVKPGGKIFVGDVRSLPLLEAFHTGIQLFQASDSLTCDQLRQRIHERILHDKELVLHPDFFGALKQHLPQISHVETQLKRGHTSNELIRFRSDVILHIQNEVEVLPEPPNLDWQTDRRSVPQICEFLQQVQPDAIRITGVTDARIFSEIKAVEMLALAQADETVGMLRMRLQQEPDERGIYPEAFWALSQTVAYDPFITWSRAKTPGVYDVVLRRRSHSTQSHSAPFIVEEPPVALKPWSAYATNPRQFNEAIHLVPQLRTFLQTKLPDYMIPSAFVVMESFPLTLNGKIDRRSLPDPKKQRPMLSQNYVAPTSALEQQLAYIWTQVLEIEPVGIYDSFFELGGHSLLAAELLSQIEEATHVEIPLFYLLKDPTIHGLVKSINRLKDLTFNPEPQLHTPIDWDSEICLDPTICLDAPDSEPTHEFRHIFLTGATGFLGAFLLDELLLQTQATIYCLVRAHAPEEARQRLLNNLEHYRLWNPEHDSRIVPVPGDLSQPLLGLDRKTFDALADQMDLIYHCGAFVNLVYPYEMLRAANVLGTQEILKLACQGKLTPVHFISTIDVQKPLIQANRRAIQEHEHPNQAHSFDMGYTQTKWVSEKLIMAAASRGLPTCIYRPGMLTGHSQTGVVQTNDLMCRIIKGLVQLGAAPDLDQRVNMIPVDFASKAIIYLSRKPESWGKSFHIANPHTVHWHQLIEGLRTYGYPVEILSHEDWKTQLAQSSKSQKNVLTPMLSLFTEKDKNQRTYLETFLETAQAFDCKNTFEGLLNAPIICPPISQQLLNTYFSYFVRSNFLDAPLCSSPT